MSKVSLPFWNAGQAFEPQVFPEDLAQLEDDERAAVAAKSPRKPGMEVLRVQKEFLAMVLAREPEPKEKPSHVVRRGPKEALEAFRERLKTDGHSDPSKVAEDAREATVPGLKLTVAEIRGGFLAVYERCQDWRNEAEANRPLGNGGATSVPSPSQA